MKIFSDSGRILKIAAALLLLLILGIWAEKHSLVTSPSVGQCLRYPEKYDGTELEIPMVARISGISPGGAIINIDAQNIRVYSDELYSDPKLAIGEPVSIRATFRKQGFLEASDHRIHLRWNIKVRMSALALLYAVFLFFSRYRWSSGAFIFVRR